MYHHTVRVLISYYRHVRRHTYVPDTSHASILPDTRSNTTRKYVAFSKFVLPGITINRTLTFGYLDVTYYTGDIIYMICTSTALPASACTAFTFPGERIG